eukprot:764275-Hanusia_phi.AAC.3
MAARDEVTLLLARPMEILAKRLGESEDKVRREEEKLAVDRARSDWVRDREKSAKMYRKRECNGEERLVGVRGVRGGGSGGRGSRGEEEEEEEEEEGEF